MKLREARIWLAGALCAALAVFAVQPAAQAAKAPTDQADQINEDEIPGEAVIATKFQFVRFRLDGKEWDNHEYINSARTLVIKGIGRNDQHTLVLTPQDAAYEPFTITLEPKDFKRTIVKQKGRTQTLAFRAQYKVDFDKVAAAPKPADPKPGEAEPK